MENLRISLTDGAAEYIRLNGGHAWLRPSPRHGCCGGLVYLPVAELGRPAESSRYVKVQVQNVTMYLHPALIHTAATGMTLRVDGFWRWRKLFVESTEEDKTT